MVYEMSISTNFSISNFCFPNDPIYDLSFRISNMLNKDCVLRQDGSRVSARADYSDYPLSALYYMVDKKGPTDYPAEDSDLNCNPEINETKLNVRLDVSIIPHFSEQLQDKINNDDDLMHLIRRQIVAILYPDVFITNCEIIINERHKSDIYFYFTLTK